ncbi:MAG: TIGR03086 family metal-binding protein [Acidimicrobiia bacterium]
MPLSKESRDAFLQALDLFDSRVSAASSETWSSPSPCEGWTAQDVVAHLVTNLRALRAALDGGDFFAVFGQPVEGDVLGAWRHERSSAAEWLDEASVVEAVTVGGNSVPLFLVVDGLMRDLVIHTWDVARAVGGDERLPDDLVATATKAMAMVTDEARGPGLYGYEVPAPPDADAQERLLALAGRRVR